jgi:choline kinase
MVNSIILSAGQGRRLRPLTDTRPKCLLPVGAKTVLEWEIEALLAAGIRHSTVVVGFGATMVDRVLAERCPPAACVQTVLNPRFAEADNLISCWAARHRMSDDFLLINGDTLFEPRIVRRLLLSPPAPVTIAVGRKHVYDADDMKIIREGSVLCRIGKDLPADRCDGESIGMALFRGPGPRLFREALEAAEREPGAARRWYLSVVDEMAARGLVQTLSVDGLRWAEIDFPRDLEAAQSVAWALEGPLGATQPALGREYESRRRTPSLRPLPSALAP